MSETADQPRDHVAIPSLEGRSLVLWICISLLMIAAMAYLHLLALPDRTVPLTFGLPLLVCLYHRDLRLLYATAVSFAVLIVIKLTQIMPEYAEAEPWYRWASLAMQQVNIWVFTGVVHGLVYLRCRDEKKATLLQKMNADLEGSNLELATREEEIVQQNQELQAQAGELEQQAEEMRHQGQELEQQASELHSLNHELSRREKGLQTLLESARWLRSDIGEDALLATICNAAVQVMEEGVVAAAVVHEHEGSLIIRGHHGFGIHSNQRQVCQYERSFASLVMETRRTAYVHDLTTRPDIEYVQPPVGRPFASILGTPVWVDGKVICAVEVYSVQPRHWSAEEFRIVEWIAAQIGLALQALDYQHGLERRRREAEQASVQKTQFLAAVSHDVRTPANAISLLADVIEQSADDPRFAHELPRMVRDLRSNARALVDLVSDVLDLARLDAGKVEQQCSSFALNSLLETEVRQHVPVAQAKGISLAAVLPPKSPWVRTDKMKLARVVSNLIGNAVKFTETGEVRVALAERVDGGLEISISDTGMGIAQEQLALIFDEFYQIRNPERDRNKGAGLGLAICKRLADALGCSISVESALGKGSVFRVRIPQSRIIAAPAEPGAAPKPAHGVPGPHFQLTNLRVLLVEDHDGTRRAAAQLLVAQGAHVFQAANGRSAIQMLAHERPDVLLLDLMLPDMDGTEVLRQLQNHRPERLRCILAVSGDVRAERETEVCRLGADGLIPKPLKMDDLLAAIARHMTVPDTPRPVPPVAEAGPQSTLLTASV